MNGGWGGDERKESINDDTLKKRCVHDYQKKAEDLY